VNIGCCGYFPFDGTGLEANSFQAADAFYSDFHDADVYHDENNLFNGSLYGVQNADQFLPRYAVFVC
jgi:hypothetical protein